MKYAALLALVSGFGLAVAIPQLRADEWNQRTDITFSGPVEIPGHVLQAGTYTFRLVDTQADLNVVEVSGKDNGQFYGIFLAVPDYRMTTPSKPIITFSERVAGAPEAVKAWFYPGDNYGHEFVYPKTEASRLAKANHEAVASMPDSELDGKKQGSAASFHGTHVNAVQPTGEEVDRSQAFGNKTDSTSRR